MPGPAARAREDGRRTGASSPIPHSQPLRGIVGSGCCHPERNILEERAAGLGRFLGSRNEDEVWEVVVMVWNSRAVEAAVLVGLERCRCRMSSDVRAQGSFSWEKRAESSREESEKVKTGPTLECAQQALAEECEAPRTGPPGEALERHGEVAGPEDGSPTLLTVRGNRSRVAIAGAARSPMRSIPWAWGIDKS
jgi:hypothetical protein